MDESQVVRSCCQIEARGHSGALSNNAFERPVAGFTSARGQRRSKFAPSARLGTQRPAAQRER